MNEDGDMMVAHGCKVSVIPFGDFGIDTVDHDIYPLSDLAIKQFYQTGQKVNDGTFWRIFEIETAAKEKKVLKTKPIPQIRRRDTIRIQEEESDSE
jgi:hypothetical protein